MNRTMRLALAALTSLACWGTALCAFAQESARSERNVARVEGEDSNMRAWKLFFVGTNRYDNLGKDNQLQYAVNDVKSLRDKFIQLGVPEDNIVCLTSDEVGPLNTTRKNILRAFDDFIESLEKEDAVFLHLSGHGFMFEDTGKSYYGPSDLEVDKDESIRDTGISIDDMLERLEKSQAHFKWAVVDTCRNDPTKPSATKAIMSKGAGVKEKFVVAAEGLPEDSFVFMQSCKNGQCSIEAMSKSHGLFTCALLEALQTDDNPIDLEKKTGTVYFNELVDFVQRRTNELAKELNDTQVPYVTNRNVPRFVFLSDLRIEGLTLAQRTALDEVEKLLDQNDVAGALEAFDELARNLKESPRGIELERRLKDADVASKADEAYAEAEEALADRDFAAARAEIARALKEFPENEKYRKLQARIDRAQNTAACEAYRDATLLRQAGDIAAAKERVEIAISLANADFKAQCEKLRDELETLGSQPQPTPQPQPATIVQKPELPVETPSHSRKAGDRCVVTIKGVAVAFRWCPAGTFMMGSADIEEGRRNGETQHEATLTKGFWMAETESTQELWKAVTNDNPSYYKDDLQLPVESVSWEDVQQFVEEINALGVGVFRLPTETEWEYACRAGTQTPFSFGSSLNGDMANCNGSEPYPLGAPKGVSVGKTSPVGSYAPNAWGLHDMHGNVSEWCSDWYSTTPDFTAPDPTGPAEGSVRVVRGGGSALNARTCRSASRFSRSPSSAGSGFGFRLVMLDEPQRLLAVQKRELALPTSAASSSAHRKAGELRVVKIKDVEVAFRWCPPGTFLMGSPKHEDGRKEYGKVWGDLEGKNVERAHNVALTRGFWMAETETTQELWESVTGDNPSSNQNDLQLPVEKVSWGDVQRFIRTVNSLGAVSEGKFRLPTEAEWEYACRAGSTTPFNNGKTLTPNNANCMYNSLVRFISYFSRLTDEESDSDSDADMIAKTSVVRSFEANAWGLYDMHGNVSEWCADWFALYPEGAATDPTGPTSGTFRVVRGGSWFNVANECRSASRCLISPLGKFSACGFRLLLTDD